MIKIRAGFVPLLDCAVLLVAERMGFATREGLDLELVRDVSWANVRDRMAFGVYDIAQMPAPLVVADKLGLSPVPMNAVAPMALGTGGNAITVSMQLWQDMGGDNVEGLPPPATTALMLAGAVRERHAKGLGPPVFGIVHPYSSHNYELRYWMASAGINPDNDVRLVVVPPPMTTDALKSGRIDGFCVGAPWNTRAATGGIGRIVATKAQIWRMSPEKVLAVSETLLARAPDTVQALLRALHVAARWADRADNRRELAEMLSSHDVVDAPEDMLHAILNGSMTVEQGKPPVLIPDFCVFERQASSFPWVSHALWLTSQMRRWGQVGADKNLAEAARAAFRPDIYRRALAGVATIPSSNSKVEGALDHPTPFPSTDGKLMLGPDGFFDGRRFDPDDMEGYLKALQAIA
jgi:two-component system, oxyanion-binding sensor